MYTIRVLEEKEFDKLPYKKAKTSLGLADQKTNMAYVRDTGYGDITKGTINHELDELLAKTSPHEEDGIRYKSLASYGAGAGGNALSNIVGGFLGNKGGILGKFGNMVKGASPLISAGAGALANRKGNPWQGAMQGFAGGGAGSGIMGGLAGGIRGLSQPGGTFGKALQGFKDIGSNVMLNYAGEVPGFKGVGTSSPEGAFAKFFKGSGGDMKDIATKTLTSQRGGQPQGPAGPLGPAGSNMPASVEPAVVNETLKPKGGDGNIITNIMDSFSKAAPGLLTAQMGQSMAPEVNTPDFGGITDDLRSQMQTGGNPMAKDMGMDELTRGLTTPMGTPPDTAFTAGDMEAQKQLTDKLNTFDNYWKSQRPGADFQNDSEFQAQRQKIINEHSAERTAARDELSFQYNQQQLQQKYQYMTQALNIDQAQMQQYVQLAQMDINQMMLEYGIDVQTATDFKQMFSDLAGIQLQGAFPQQGGLGDVMSQFTQGGK